MSQKILYSCIVFFLPDAGIRPRKYRNVNSLMRFEKFVTSMGGIYYNVYNKRTREFIERVYIKKAG